MFKPKEMAGLVIVTGALYYMVSRDLIKLWSVERDVAAETVDAINPASEGNIFFKWTTKLYQDITGSKQTPGEDIYDLMHSRPPDNPADAADGPAMLEPSVIGIDDDEYIDSWRLKSEVGYYG